MWNSVERFWKSKNTPRHLTKGEVRAEAIGVRDKRSHSFEREREREKCFIIFRNGNQKVQAVKTFRFYT